MPRIYPFRRRDGVTEPAQESANCVIPLRGRSGRPRCPSILPSVAKDTEKLIRQLSLISFLMANRRPVSALEILSLIHI